MAEIHHRVVMSGSRDEVFAAVTDAVVSRATEAGASVHAVVFDQGARAVWRCTDGSRDWVGTEIAIELAGEGPDTVVRFCHRHWKEATDALATCTTRWARLLIGLQDLVAIPEPDDTRI